MSKIFEIDRQIAELLDNSIDPETGEFLLDEGLLEKLSMERDRKIENLLMYYKDCLASAAAIKTEIDALTARKQVLENKAERLANYADSVLKGDRFETAKVKVSYRNSTPVEVSEGCLEWLKVNRDDLLKYKEPDIDKKKLKKALENGEEIKGAAIVTKRNIQIK